MELVGILDVRQPLEFAQIKFLPVSKAFTDFVRLPGSSVHEDHLTHTMKHNFRCFIETKTFPSADPVFNARQNKIIFARTRDSLKGNVHIMDLFSTEIDAEVANRDKTPITRRKSIRIDQFRLNLWIARIF